MNRSRLLGYSILTAVAVIVLGMFVLWRGASSPPPVVQLAALPPLDTSPALSVTDTPTFTPVSPVPTDTPTFTPVSPVPTDTPSLSGSVANVASVAPSLTPTRTPSPAPTDRPTPQAVARLDTLSPRSNGDDLGILTPPAPDYPAQVNGITRETFVVISAAVARNVRDIYAYGQTMGRDPRAFSKAGDSTIENPHFLARFDGDFYNLGDYTGLQAVIDYYAGSFARQGMAVKRGMHAWTMFDALWASAPCAPSESPIGCEIRLHNPSLVLIRLGTNDVGVPESFEQNMRLIIEYCIAQGVVPVIGTKADRRDGPGNPNNTILRRLAEEYAVPLWDFDRVAGTLPGRGLDEDNAHMTTYYAHDYTQSVAFTRGHALHNLTALIALDQVWRVMAG